MLKKWGDYMESIVSLIQSVGFPIACAIALFWQNNKMQEQHKEEMLKLTEALKNNTVAIIELKNSLDDNRKDVSK